MTNEKTENSEVQQDTVEAKKGRPRTKVEPVEKAHSDLVQSIYNLEQALARVAHATGTSQFTDMYGIKKEAQKNG